MRISAAPGAVAAEAESELLELAETKISQGIVQFQFGGELFRATAVDLYPDSMEPSFAWVVSACDS